MRRPRMSPAERAEIDALFDRVEKENKAIYAAEPAPKPDDVANMAKFLKGWARRKPITKVGGDGNSFWKSGKYVTKLSPKMVDALLAAGFVSRINGALYVTGKPV